MKRIQSLVWSPDAEHLAASSDDGGVRIWHVPSSDVVRTLQAVHGGARSLSWSPDGRWLACAEGHWDNRSAGFIQVWDAGSGEEAWTTEERTQGCYALCFSPDGRWLASGHGSGMVYLWDAGTGEKALEIATGEDITNLINGVGFSPDGASIGFGTCYEDKLYVYTTDGQCQAEVTYERQASWVDFEHPVRFSPVGQWLARGTQEGPVRLWPTASYSSPVSLTGHDMPTYAISWHPGDQVLAGGSRDGQIRIWDVESTKEVGSMAHGRPLHTVCYSPDGRLLASGGDDPTIRLWNGAPESETLGENIQTLTWSQSDPKGRG